MAARMFDVEEVLERLDGDNGLSSDDESEKASMGSCQRLIAISLVTWPAEEHRKTAKSSSKKTVVVVLVQGSLLVLCQVSFTRRYCSSSVLAVSVSVSVYIVSITAR